MGKYEEAITACNQALQIDPDNNLAPIFIQQAREKVMNDTKNTQ